LPVNFDHNSVLLSSCGGIAPNVDRLSDWRSLKAVLAGPALILTKDDFSGCVSVRWVRSIVPISLDKTTTEKRSEGEIILTIRKPDMMGNSKWLFSRGKFPVSAKITDDELHPVPKTPSLVFYGTGGASWREGSLRGSSSLRRFG
jgi:hypothetical protein